MEPLLNVAERVRARLVNTVMMCNFSRVREQYEINHKVSGDLVTKKKKKSDSTSPSALLGTEPTRSRFGLH